MNWIDVDQIAPNLWQGSNPPQGDVLAQEGFQVLVLCAEERQYHAHFYPGLRVIHAPMDDGHWVPKETASRAAQQVARYMRAGKKVLVCCNMGLNRSGLVTALALWYTSGMPGAQCMWHVQTRRRSKMGMQPLSNPSFAIFLYGLPGRGARRRHARAA